MTPLPNFVEWDSIPTRRLAPGVTLRIFSSARVMLSLVELEPGAVVPAHQHPHEQLGIWLAGEAEATIGDSRKRVRAGDSYYIPGGAEHTFVAGPNGGRALDIFHPPREDYLTP
ncbi:MAG TPA: cupin domain-containing protein [Chloroflexota bacterium]|jgi:quercetin dioxygenase-like cupin family protein|nr:cupin domain-containing protein [Chloroflexota bacterium]